jgi:hypothetical protein
MVLPVDLSLQLYDFGLVPNDLPCLGEVVARWLLLRRTLLHYGVFDSKKQAAVALNLGVLTSRTASNGN